MLSPKVTLTALPKEGPAPLQVTFTAKSATISPLPEGTYTWDFGDQTATAAVNAHKNPAISVGDAGRAVVCVVRAFGHAPGERREVGRVLGQSRIGRGDVQVRAVGGDGAADRAGVQLLVIAKGTGQQIHAQHAAGLRADAEAVLAPGESLSSFVHDAVTRTIEYRKAQQEFVERGLASAAKARRTGRYVSSSAALRTLRRQLVQGRATNKQS